MRAGAGLVTLAGERSFSRSGASMLATEESGIKRVSDAGGAGTVSPTSPLGSALLGYAAVLFADIMSPVLGMGVDVELVEGDVFDVLVVLLLVHPQWTWVKNTAKNASC